MTEFTAALAIKSFVKLLVLLACPVGALSPLFKLPPERLAACDCLVIQTEAGFLD